MALRPLLLATLNCACFLTAHGAMVQFTVLDSFDGNRFYHLMGGEDERAGGALLYFNLSRPLDLTGAQREYPSPMKFLVQARQQQGVWVDVEKPFWYDTPVCVPATSRGCPTRRGTGFGRRKSTITP